MEKCDYCNIRPASYKLKNGRNCCEEFWQQCPKKRAEKSFIMEEVMNRPESKERIRKLRTGAKDSKETREKKRVALLGNKRKKGKIESFKTRKRKSKSHTYTLSDYKEKHPLLLKVEEIRENPVSKKLQGRCKNHKCKNSKEKNGWFTLKPRQIENRLRAIYYQNDGLYFYCSKKCKDECLLYGLQSDPYEIKKTWSYTQQEYETWRNEVLRRADNLCEYCGKDAVHAHHVKPQKLEEFFSLDPDYGVACCEKCHHEKGHPKGTECSTGNLSKIICSNKLPLKGD